MRKRERKKVMREGLRCGRERERKENRVKRKREIERVGMRKRKA